MVHSSKVGLPIHDGLFVLKGVPPKPNDQELKVKFRTPTKLTMAVV